MLVLAVLALAVLTLVVLAPKLALLLLGFFSAVVFMYVHVRIDMRADMPLARATLMIGELARPSKVSKHNPASHP